jgi:hypothetical protein
MTTKIEKTEYASFFQPYITAISDNNMGLIENLEYSHKKALELLSSISKEKQIYRYAEDKWTIKEIVQHIIDAERVFNYRALRFARRDNIELPGFDENQFALHSNADQRDYKSLLDEFSALRRTTLYLYDSFSDDALLECGRVNGNTMSVRALGYLTSGHLLHHLNVIKSRYL